MPPDFLNEHLRKNLNKFFFRAHNLTTNNCLAYRDKMKKMEEEKQEKLKSFTNYDDSDFDYFGDLFKESGKAVAKNHSSSFVKQIFEFLEIGLQM